MQRILLNVQAFEKEFARKQMDCYTEDKKKQLAVKRRELSKSKNRIAEIDALIQKIYEDNASGKLSDERYATLSRSYEEEQKTLKAAVPEMQAYLETETDKTRACSGSEGETNHGVESADSGADPRVRGQNRGLCAEND